MVKKVKKNQTLLEEVSFADHGRVDRKRGVVKDCKILGMESRHGYKYTAGAMKGAIELYEGAKVNIDHPNRKTPGASRSYRDRFGKFKNVRFVEGDGLRGDFNFNPEHEIANQFAWDVENNPDNCGFSHNASGPLVKRGGQIYCESIEAVRSVDLVADAATTASLFEGKPSMKIRKRTRKAKMNKAAIRRKLFEGFGKKVANVLLENVDMNGQQAVAEAAPTDGSKGGNVDALLALVRQVLEDPNITAEESIKAVSKRLKALKEMIPGGSAKDAAPAKGEAAMEGAGDDDDDDDVEDPDDDDLVEDDDDEEDDDDLVEDRGQIKKGKKGAAKAGGVDAEVLKRLARLEAREERVEVMELCESAGFRPTDKQMKLLLACEDEDTRNDLLESWAELQDAPANVRKTIKGGKAKSRELVEGGSGKGKAYKDTKEWAAGLKA